VKNISLTKSAGVALETMREVDRERIEHVIDRIAEKNPKIFFENSKKLLSKFKDLYEFKVDDFRIIYRVSTVEGESRIEIIDIARKERMAYLSSGKK